ncbi:hypothetical protein [Thiocystis violascens]|uniref:Uncharacterized protein n=1 Tax=Thiocystis violascens (strain ATCC 17096 / DSM 198 / 6111) TaxID=765911 RepID=I3Y5J0_THIV6|nr:hypothetical protein [Thiocystis violascens]AFL72258.1 hypothetical protein Thivi_0186 [Thiocystis violascens DSM 198]
MKLKQTWQALPPADRLRWLAIGTAIAVGLYGLLIFPFANRELTKSTALVARRTDRIEKRAQVPQVDVGTAAALQGKLPKIVKQKEALEARYGELAGRFTPGDTPGAHQLLLLELNTLAESSGIQLLKQGDESDGRRGLTPLRDQESGRPYMRVQGAGDYWGLLAFLRGLGNLNYASAPLGVELRTEGEPKAQQSMLNISIDVTL